MCVYIYIVNMYTYIYNSVPLNPSACVMFTYYAVGHLSDNTIQNHRRLTNIVAKWRNSNPASPSTSTTYRSTVLLLCLDVLIPQHHYNPQAFPDDQIEFAASSMAFLVGIHLSWDEQKCRPNSGLNNLLTHWFGASKFTNLPLSFIHSIALRNRKYRKTAIFHGETHRLELDVPFTKIDPSSTSWGFEDTFRKVRGQADFFQSFR